MNSNDREFLLFGFIGAIIGFLGVIIIFGGLLLTIKIILSLFGVI